MGKKDEQAANPYQHEYGVWSNTWYILGKIRQYCPVLLVLMAAGMVTGSVTMYMYSIIGKLFIDIVEQQAGLVEKTYSRVLCHKNSACDTDYSFSDRWCDYMVYKIPLHFCYAAIENYFSGLLSTHIIKLDFQMTDSKEALDQANVAKDDGSKW